MRFYSEIRIEPLKHLEEISENPHLVFSTDFMYYLAALHEVDWRPMKVGSNHHWYQPHPFSPCTKNVKKAMHHIIDKSALDYELIYDELVPEEADNKLELFTYRATRILHKLTDNPLDTFFTLLHLGRWTFTFYKHGTKDSAHLVPHLMADAIKKVIGNSSDVTWFTKLDVIAQDLAELLGSGFTEGFAEEYYHYFEELETDDDEEDFDECSLCVCGGCDCEMWDEASSYDEEERSLYDESSAGESEDIPEIVEDED